jgi:hypothetical protein
MTLSYVKIIRLLGLSLLVGISDLTLVFGQSGVGAGTISISGKYSYIFSNGAPPETNDYQFTAITSANGWNISMTNTSEPKEWGIIQSDGTNIYTLSTDSLNGYKTFGYAFLGPFYVPAAAQDSVRFFFPWMVFHLSPQMILDLERKGIVDLPAPWGSRDSLINFGFSWKTTYSDGGRTIQRIEVVRDSALDLKSVEEELRRTNINYPFEFSSRERRLLTLQIRKDIPNGFVRAIYECNILYKTNDWVIPSAAHFTEYWPNFKDPQGPVRLVYEMQLSAEKISILPNERLPELLSPSDARVWDYRYETATDRTKCNCAEYILKSGEPFPTSHDPKLMAQANELLKHGPTYDNLNSKRTKVLAGMFAMTTIGVGLLAFWLFRKNKT